MLIGFPDFLVSGYQVSFQSGLGFPNVSSARGTFKCYYYLPCGRRSLHEGSL